MYLAVSHSWGERVFPRATRSNGVYKYGLTKEIKKAANVPSIRLARQHASRMSSIIMRQFEVIDATTLAIGASLSGAE
jgi:hypothetical protein